MNEARLEMMDDDVGGYVEGEMTVPFNKNRDNLGKPDFNTLDEPIKETILRDIKAVGVKFAHVLFPKEKKTLLKEWDLWGPLLLCTFMATILQGYRPDDKANDGGPAFSEVYAIVGCGSITVTLNSRFLGGKMSFFQTVCVIGYCLLPTAMALVVCRIILLVEQTVFLFFLRLCVSICGFLWATYASMVFLGDSQKEGRKVLAMYPICLFYFLISWLVVSNTTA